MSSDSFKVRHKEKLKKQGTEVYLQRRVGGGEDKRCSSALSVKLKFPLMAKEAALEGPA